MKKYTIIIGLLSFCFYGFSQKMKNIKIDNIIYTQLAQKFDFNEYKLLNGKEKLTYYLNIENADGLSEIVKKELSNINVFQFEEKTTSLNSDIIITLNIANLKISNPVLDSSKTLIGYSGWSNTDIKQKGVPVYGLYYKSELAFSLNLKMELNNKAIYDESFVDYKHLIKGQPSIPKSIVTDTLFKGNFDDKAIVKQIRRNDRSFTYNLDPYVLFEMIKDREVREYIKGQSIIKLDILKTIFSDVSNTVSEKTINFYKKKKTNYDVINNASSSLAEILNKNSNVNLHNLSQEDNSKIEEYAKVIINEIQNNFDTSSKVLLSERYNEESILGLYKTLTFCFYILKEYEKVIITHQQVQKIGDSKIRNKYFKDVGFLALESKKVVQRKQKIIQFKELSKWINNNPNFRENQVLLIQFKYLQKQLNDKSFSIDDFLNAPKLLNESNYKQIVFNIGKESQDTLWATSLDSLVLNGVYIDSSNKITKKIFYDNGKIKTKTLVKFTEEKVYLKNEYIDLKIYEKKSTYVGDTSDQINYVVELIEWHENGSTKRISNWNETVERGGTYVYDPSKGEYVRKTQDYFRAKVEEWYDNGQQRTVASYMLLEGAENYDENDLTGDYLEWHKNGQQKIKTSYTWNSQGKIHAQIQGKYEEWYESGQQKQLGNYQPNLFAGGGSEALTMIGFLKMANIHGCVYGDLTQWYENGNKKTEMTAYMKEGFGFMVISTGTKRSWYENGQIKKEVAYGTHSADEGKTNLPISEKYWDADGNLNSEKHRN